jgi:hypothetical protein
MVISFCGIDRLTGFNLFYAVSLNTQFKSNRMDKKHLTVSQTQDRFNRQSLALLTLVIGRQV